jgi:hypothetical protein
MRPEHEQRFRAFTGRVLQDSTKGTRIIFMTSYLQNGIFPDSLTSEYSFVGSAGGFRGRTAVLARLAGVASRRRIEPCMRFSRTRLSDIVHRQAYAVVGLTVPVRR